MLKSYTPRPEHSKLFKEIFGIIRSQKIDFIADIGSGRTSLYNITSTFPNAVVDAIIEVPTSAGIKQMKKAVKSKNWEVVKADITTQRVNRQYDLSVAHLAISRGIDRGHTLEDMKRGVFSVFTK